MSKMLVLNNLSPDAWSDVAANALASSDKIRLQFAGHHSEQSAQAGNPTYMADEVLDSPDAQCEEAEKGVFDCRISLSSELGTRLADIVRQSPGSLWEYDLLKDEQPLLQVRDGTDLFVSEDQQLPAKIVNSAIDKVDPLPPTVWSKI